MKVVARNRESGQRSRFEVPRILVIEDDDDNRELFVSYFESRGLDVMTATNGLEGVEATTRFRPDVIVIDIAMPIMDGWEATRRLREMPEARSTFVIALTAFADPASRRRSLESGCDLHLAKPISPADLFHAVMRALEARALHVESADAG